MKEWKTYRLGDIITISSGFPYKGEFIGKGNNYLLGMGCVSFKETFLKSGLRQYSGDAPERYIAQPGDIVLATRQQSDNLPILGMPAIIPQAYNGYKMIIGANLYKVQNESEFSNAYIYWLMKSPAYVHHIKSCQTGTTVRMITKANIEDFTFKAPEKSERDKIASFLWNIEEKIAINRQINDNLEQQASSILSDWTSTYPCRTYKLSDICKYVSAKCDTGNLTSQNYISTENMLPNKKGIVDASNIPTGKVTCFKVDDILIANIRPYFQKIWKADTSGGCSTDVLCIRSCVESHSPILYWILHQDAFFEYVMTGAKGCKMPRGDKQHIMNWTIDLPEPDYWADIATQLGAVDQRIAYNRIESNNLSNLRDTLLPKLMSGELKINEIDC